MLNIGVSDLCLILSFHSQSLQHSSVLTTLCFLHVLYTCFLSCQLQLFSVNLYAVNVIGSRITLKKTIWARCSRSDILGRLSDVERPPLNFHGHGPGPRLHKRENVAENQPLPLCFLTGILSQ